MTMISIHTFELTMETNQKNFKYLLSCAFQKAKKHHRVGRSTKFTSSDVRIDDALASKGITIEYHNYEFRKMIKLCINPSIVLGGDDLKIWKPSINHIDELLELLNNHIDEYFDSNYEINDFLLTRIDFTANLDVGKKNVPAYIQLMHKLGKVKKFSAKYSKSDYSSGKIDKATSFDLKGKTNGIEFSVYDKEADLRSKGKLDKAKKALGILRVEIRLEKKKAVHEALSNFTDDNNLTTEEQFALLALNSKAIFLTWLVQILPYGNFFSLKDAQHLVKNSHFKQKRKEKMLKLLELIPKKKSLYHALKELNLRNSNDILLWFAELNVSPITISKRQKGDFFKNLYDYLEE